MGHDQRPLLDPPERTRDWLDSLETRFRRAYGRDMTPEERRFFALAEPIVRFDPNGKSREAERLEFKPEEAAEKNDFESPDGGESQPPKAA